VFSLSNLAKAASGPALGLAVLTCTACAGLRAGSNGVPTAQTFYTVTGEIALARHEPRVAALQYAVAAAGETDPDFLQRAAEVGTEALQPSLVESITARWISLDPNSLEAHRTAARAALALYRIESAASDYRMVLTLSPLGTEAEFAAVETDLESTDNIFGARQLADRLAGWFPNSAAALRVQGLAALRADDPAAAVHGLTGALSLEVAPVNDGAEQESGQLTRRDLAQTLARARIMAGDGDAPLAQAREILDKDKSSANRFDYAVLLMTAQREADAAEQLRILSGDKESQAVALRLLGMIEFQQGHLDAASAKFTQLLTTGKFLDEAFYYLALIADRNEDPERALRLYAQVQKGENVLPALLRAAALLQKHNAPSAAEELLDRLVEDEPQRAPEILIARSRMYADSHEFPKAFAVLERAVVEYPDSVELRYARASMYEETGQVGAALQELAGVVKIRPNDPAALNALGFTLADHARELSRARKLIERAYAAAPRNAAILDSLGWVMFRQGHANEALPYLTAAYADDRGGDIAAHLGEVLWQLGNRDSAEHIWSEASAVDTDNQLLKSTRQRLHPAT
jgi:tetratricopeptide (TPR) repeat protein